VETRARWTDACGNFWLYGAGSTNSLYIYKTAINQWMWVRGNGFLPIYGTIGVSAPNNTPSQRTGAIGWIGNGELWLFGGAGIDASTSIGDLNDLWRYVPDTACGGCDLNTSGINENNNSEIFSVYPNPSSGIFTVTSQEEITTIEIYNVLGEKIYKSEMRDKKYAIDLSGKAKGIYFVRIQSGDKISTQKILLNE